METTIKTSFNFAKEIQCNFITKNNPEHSYTWYKTFQGSQYIP